MSGDIDRGMSDLGAVFGDVRDQQITPRFLGGRLATIALARIP
jgi:hypothetical protein